MQPNGLVRGHIGSRVGYVHTRTQSVNTQTQSVSKLGYLGARFGYSGNTQDSFEGKNLINVLNFIDLSTHIHTQTHMTPKKKADDELGSIVEVSGSFRVEVKLFGRTRAGPMRVEHRGDARPFCACRNQCARRRHCYCASARDRSSCGSREVRR